jgi:multiple sugar transport system permease protein
MSSAPLSYTGNPAEMTTEPDRKRKALSRTNWMMLLPAAGFFCLFTIAPLVLLAWSSFNSISWQVGVPVFEYVGLANYAGAIRDNLFKSAIWNTTIFAIAAVTLQIIIGFLLALLVQNLSRGEIFYRTALLLPILMPGIVVGAIWKLMLNYDFGLVNQVLGQLGVEGRDWLGDQATALASVVIVDVWHWVPFSFLILLTGLQSISDEVLEAARLDGANAWKRFRHIILPIMMPTLAVTFLFRLVMAYKVFDEVFLLTGGGPGTSTEVMSFTIYRRFFVEDRAGYGASLSVLAIILIGVVLFLVNQIIRTTLKGRRA